VPVAILNRGPTRGDPLAQLRVDARAGKRHAPRSVRVMTIVQ
jgi:hypothetical protein